MFEKKLLKILQIFLSSEICFSASVRIVFSPLDALFVKRETTVFQNVLLSVIFFVLRLSKYDFWFSSIVSYISFAEFYNFPCLFDFYLLKLVSISWSLYNSIVKFFSHERDSVCTKEIFFNCCMFIEDAEDWLHKQAWIRFFLKNKRFEFQI